MDTDIGHDAQHMRLFGVRPCGAEECKDSEIPDSQPEIGELSKDDLINCIKWKNFDACTNKLCIYSIYHYQTNDDGSRIQIEDVWETDTKDGKEYCTECGQERQSRPPHKWAQIDACMNGNFGDLSTSYMNDAGGRGGANPMLDEARRRQQQSNPRPPRGESNPAWKRFTDLKREVKKHDTMKKFYAPRDVPTQVQEKMAEVFQVIEQAGVVENGVLPKGEMRYAIYIVVLHYVSVHNCLSLDSLIQQWVNLTPDLENKPSFHTNVGEAIKILNHAIPNSVAAIPINSQRTNCLQNHSVFNAISKEVERVTTIARKFLADRNPSETEVRVFTAAYILQKTKNGKKIAKDHGFTTASIDNIVTESDCVLDKPSRQYLKSKLPAFVRFMKS